MYALLTLMATSFLIGFSGACTPGPLLFSVIVHSGREGFRAGPLNVVGHFIVEGSLAAALVAGLAAVIREEVAKTVIGLAGGLLLLFMAVDMLRYARKASLSKVREGQAASPALERWGPITMGAVTSASNPFLFLWWLSVGNSLLFMGLRLAGLVGAALVYMAHISSDLAWYSLVSYSIDKGRRIITDKVYKAILVVCGVLLVYIALQFVYAGLSPLL